MTKHANVLATYQRIRQTGVRLNHALVETLDKRALDEGGRSLGLLKRGTLVFESEEEMPVLMDYCIYHVRRDGRNAVQRYLAESPPPADSEEMALLTAMEQAYYSLFQVQEIERGVGVTVLDVLRGDTAFLADVGFGSSAQQGVVMATRVIPMEGFLMTAGAALPVTPAALSRIRKDLEQTFAPETDFRQLSPAQEAALAALVIRDCLAAGVSTQIRYQEPSETSSLGTRGASPRRRIGRNDPCPCGSGKKYKLCCGRR